MKHKVKSIIGVLLVLSLIFSMMYFSPVKPLAAGAATGDIVTYGSYPQSKVTDTDLITALNSQTLQADNTVTYDGAKYLRVFFTVYNAYWGGTTTGTGSTYQDNNGYYINTVYWFKFEPLRWLVLSNTGGELLLVSEKILEARQYNQSWSAVTWETCSLRTWLNNTFYNNAFSPDEQTNVATSAVVNANNPWNGTNGGNSTNDKVFLLSHAEVMDNANGFSSSSNADTARRSKGTDFAKSCGLYVPPGSEFLGMSAWWLRSPGNDTQSAGTVDSGGGISYDSVDTAYEGVRPAIRINEACVTLTVGNIITLGSFPQTKVTSTSLINALNAEPLQTDNTVTYYGSKYQKVFFSQYTPLYPTLPPDASNSYQDNNGYYTNTVYWFKFEPLKWRVLSNSGGELLVVSEKIIDSIPFNSALSSVTWETGSIRSWLNGSFYNSAFSSSEQAKIKPSVVVNENNPNYGTNGGNNKNDKLFLLSYSEVKSAASGFSSNFGDFDMARRAQGSDFAKCSGLSVSATTS